jgi:anti-sigma B factor antagonist
MNSPQKGSSMQTAGQISEVLVVSVPGPTLDARNSKKFKGEIAPEIQSAMRVVLDMSAVQFVDSSGLGVILSLLRQLNARGGDLKIFGLSKAVRTLFELVRIHRVVEIYNTKEEALSAFGP